MKKYLAAAALAAVPFTATAQEQKPHQHPGNPVWSNHLEADAIFKSIPTTGMKNLFDRCVSNSMNLNRPDGTTAQAWSIEQKNEQILVIEAQKGDESVVYARITTKNTGKPDMLRIGVFKWNDNYVIPPIKADAEELKQQYPFDGMGNGTSKAKAIHLTNVLRRCASEKEGPLNPRTDIVPSLPAKSQEPTLEWSKIKRWAQGLTVTANKLN